MRASSPPIPEGLAGRFSGGETMLEIRDQELPGPAICPSGVPSAHCPPIPGEHDRKMKFAMWKSGSVVRVGFLSAVVFAAASLDAGRAYALDDEPQPAAAAEEKRSPWDVFRFGFNAYRSGHKEQAVEAYRYAAENGQIGARWKLARMYAEGDGVPRDDYEAFKFFQAIAQQDVEPGSPEEAYVSDALVALGGYAKRGIPGTPVKPNLEIAQEYYIRAAATYRHPVAQYEIGKMLLEGQGGMEKNVQQAARWFQLAAEKGHAGAQATLGDLLFKSGRVVRGLAMMTAALERAAQADRGWIRDMQEEAFAIAGEADRRTAIALAEDMLVAGN